jgi:2-polyprenyl-6-methoxyphenol hydroxylase-like FAD-dependent oxidoreductase
MQKMETDVDVLVVGAGPVGLFLANECARRGLRSRIIETRPTQSKYSKALAIFPRTLEIFDMAGLAAPFLEKANRVTAVTVTTHAHTLAHMPFAPEETPYPFVAMVPQDLTEKLLAEHLASKGGAVEYETTFVSAVQRDDHVNVTLDKRGQLHELTAAFVVGCDGSHSAVRHLLNLPFEGAEYRGLFLLADAETNDFLPANELQLCPSELGPLAIFPMSATRRRIIATVKSQEGDAPSLDMVRKVVAERAPSGVEIHSLHWSSYFRIHHRQVGELRRGRMFIAGDAAHIHSPFGGQGMNTGLQDIWNLVWKLDLVLHGHGNEALLDSYTAERRPVIKQVVETTDFMTKALGTPNKLAQLLRNTVIPMVSRLAPFQHAFVQRLSELGVAYSGSPIVKGAGKRHFDDTLRGGNGILSRFLLLIGQDADAPTKEAAQELTSTFKDVVELRPHASHDIMLVRPDGYIAFSAADHDTAAALQHVRTLLQRQTGSVLSAA